IEVRNATSPSQALDAFHIQNFVDGIKKGTPLNSGIAGGHQSTLLVQLGNIALRSGHILNIDPKDGHIINDHEAMKYWSRQYEPGWEPKL
ncbi:MAG: gfo/Idh/MocA family oxidoreductase, partial [Ginsengibacter sp.]